MSTEVDDFLAHYGVLGMHWGVRKGSLSSRARSASIDSVQRRLTTNKEIAGGRGQARDYFRTTTFRAGGLVTGGSTKAAAKRADTLEARMKRLTTGKKKASDVLDAMINTPITDLFISRIDKRADPGSVKARVNTGNEKAKNILLGVGGGLTLAALKIGLQLAKQSEALA